jgi:kynureninase
MTALQDMLALIDEAGLAAVRDKSVALTEFAIEAVRATLADFGVVIASPLDAAERGGHVTIDHPAFKHVTGRLWEQGVIPDFREPDGIRLGLSPLSTSFAEVWRGIAAIRAELERA